MHFHSTIKLFIALKTNKLAKTTRLWSICFFCTGSALLSPIREATKNAFLGNRIFCVKFSQQENSLIAQVSLKSHRRRNLPMLRFLRGHLMLKLRITYDAVVKAKERGHIGKFLNQRLLNDSRRVLAIFKSIWCVCDPVGVSIV